MSSFHPVLGTVLELQTTAADDATVAAAERRALATIDRLEDVFSIHRPASALSRWRSGDDTAAMPELVAVLAETEAWFVRGGGAFNPFVGRLVAEWRHAESTGAVPDEATLAAEARAIAALPYTVRDGVLVRHGECGALELHAIAKGWIVDRATEAGLAVAGVEQFVVNLGGDLRHGGTGSLLAGIEDPATPWDNAPPLTVVEIANRGLATSGSARRGFRVGEQWFGHVLDPRTGHPVEHITSASVIAADAATADVVATIVGVLEPAAALAFADALADAHGDVGVLLVDAAGIVHRNDAWRAQERG